MLRQTTYGDREVCYECYRPQSSCICSHITTLNTKAHFVLLMHGKEFRKTKNGTGHMTHKSLANSSLFVGVDFTHHTKLNALLTNPQYQPFILYPSNEATNLSTSALPLEKSKIPLFIVIDSTWACSKAILKRSKNLHNLPTISFTTPSPSLFTIKAQPEEYCLSTIETTQTILSLLNDQKLERLTQHELDHFLDPFYAMVRYQLQAANNGKARFMKLKPKGLI